MSSQLHPGINLHVIPTEKYKTIRITVRFTNRHSEKTAAARTLLTSLLETNSEKYPTQTALSSRLAELYGASFGVNVAKKGALHQVNVGMTLVNGKYVNDQKLFNEAMDFLQEIIFRPKIIAGAFDEATFTTEKENMLAYLKSLPEDKQMYASLKLSELYFKDSPDQQTPSFGTVDQVGPLTAASLAETHAQMLAEDQVDLFVVGDVTEAEVRQAFSVWPFAVSERVHPEIFYRQPLSKVINEKIETEPITQSKLNLAYHTESYYGTPQRFDLLVFNGLFGGFPHSKLFMNVREKASLAYYASSSFDSFRGVVTVQTGIDGQNREKVLHLINEQLESLRLGQIEDVALQQTKAMLKNQFLLSLDSPQALIETEYLDTWLPATKMSEAEFMETIEKVTKERIQKVAADLRLQAVFFLEGSAKRG